jgi:hypothetical protein
MELQCNENKKFAVPKTKRKRYFNNDKNETKSDDEALVNVRTARSRDCELNNRYHQLIIISC